MDILDLVQDFFQYISVAAAAGVVISFLALPFLFILTKEPILVISGSFLLFIYLIAGILAIINNVDWGRRQ